MVTVIVMIDNDAIAAVTFIVINFPLPQYMAEQTLVYFILFYSNESDITFYLT